MIGRSRHLHLVIIAVMLSTGSLASGQRDLTDGFRNPPDSARPGVYWYFMDGNRTREGMTADLESMKAAGIGNLVYLEVNVGVARGPIDFLSDAWQDMFVHAVREAERLGIEITLGSGPGWAGSGGPWVKLDQSMQHLVASSVHVQGPRQVKLQLPKPAPRTPFFGERSIPPKLRKQRDAYYEDVVVLAFPQPKRTLRIQDIDELALYYRAPYSSQPGVKPYLPFPHTMSAPADAAIAPTAIVDVTNHLRDDGTLVWNVPPGKWTVLRFGRRNNGATTRPAPEPGFGFECDKLSAAALDAHFDAYIGKLTRRVGKRKTEGGGWTMLHIDSWEMGAQNWTENFRAEFQRRRGYDPLPYLPTYTGRIVGNLEQSLRFLWDMRVTAQELLLANHAEHLKELGRRHQFGLSIEPYDMNPTSDLELGLVADVPMCEFWSDGVGFNTSYSCLESVSIAHTQGRPVIAAEAFTADQREAWTRYPSVMKNQGDWAFCAGINRFVYHTFAHKPYGRRPGMVMGPYGVHWDRGQTWWPMVSAYHRYVTRCQYLLRQGRPVADICYLIPEGAPHVFRPPPSAVVGAANMPDRRGFNFDGCAPGTLLHRAAVRRGRLTFPGGASYRLLVLPSLRTMTPPLLLKIKQLVEAGATVVGPPPLKSPSLVNYPQCDAHVRRLAEALWGRTNVPRTVTRRRFGRGQVFCGGPLAVPPPGTPVPRIIEQAKWIWYPESDPASSAAAGARYFWRHIQLDPGKTVKAARVEMTADNAFKLWVNGRAILEGADFHAVYSTDVTNLRRDADNLLAVHAVNTGADSNPAGLIGCLQVQYTDGTTQTFVTDKNWSAARAVGKNWPGRRPAARLTVAAKELGPAGMAPWRLKPRPETCPSLYPDYAATAELLHRLGAVEDFTSDGPVRYTHRRIGTIDLYFVANRSAKTIDATCRFRVTGRQPELWDPVAVTVRDLLDFQVGQRTTTVPVRFAPHQSFFIVFRQPLPPNREPTAGEPNFHDEKTMATVTGPWQVTFDPKAGGPERATFDRLQDWTARPEPGIKYYSGIATYHNTFDLPKGMRSGKAATYLNLGIVKNMARVRLNGTDLGVVWCAPWHVNITSAVRPQGNELEIEVANLWPNRLIRDESLPESKRITWTTFHPYKPDSPLLPSGLLGPVTIETATSK